MSAQHIVNLIRSTTLSTEEDFGLVLQALVTKLMDRSKVDRAFATAAALERIDFLDAVCDDWMPAPISAQDILEFHAERAEEMKAQYSKESA